MRHVNSCNRVGPVGTQQILVSSGETAFGSGQPKSAQRSASVRVFEGKVFTNVIEEVCLNGHRGRLKEITDFLTRKKKTQYNSPAFVVASGVRLILNWIDCADVKHQSCYNGNNTSYSCGFCSSFPALQPRIAQKLTLLVSSCLHFESQTWHTWISSVNVLARLQDVNFGSETLQHSWNLQLSDLNSLRHGDGRG